MSWSAIHHGGIAERVCGVTLCTLQGLLIIIGENFYFSQLYYVQVSLHSPTLPYIPSCVTNAEMLTSITLLCAERGQDGKHRQLR